jgi:hypothetical protein
MGSDDPSSSTSSRRLPTATTITSTQSTQQTSVSTQQQPTQTGGAAAKRPSFDVSAIQDPDTSVATEKVSTDAGADSETDFSGRSPAMKEVPASTEANNVVGNIPEDQEDEAMEICGSPDGPDVFPNSFEEEEERPQYSSTPCVSAPTRRISLRADLSGIGEEDASSTDDDDEVDQIFESLSSANNSQEMDEK